MASRDPYSRWRRLPPVFRSGEHRLPAPGDEPQRIILYLKAAVLDQAEVLAEKAGVATLQDYCAELLARTIEVERVKRHVAEVEAKRGTLEGFSAIADDPAYLAEWRERTDSGEVLLPGAKPGQGDGEAVLPELTVPMPTSDPFPLPELEDVLLEEAPVSVVSQPAEAPDTHSQPDRPRVRIERNRAGLTPIIRERIVPEVLDGSAINVVLAHLGPEDQETGGFLACLRRGQPVPAATGTELLKALEQVEADLRNASQIDRLLSYALHRLSLESQVLLTEAWPGVFDERTIGLIRAVQEEVERILSCEDIRYYLPRDGQAGGEDA